MGPLSVPTTFNINFSSLESLLANSKLSKDLNVGELLDQQQQSKGSPISNSENVQISEANKTFENKNYTVN